MRSGQLQAVFIGLWASTACSTPVKSTLADASDADAGSPAPSDAGAGAVPDAGTSTSADAGSDAGTPPTVDDGGLYNYFPSGAPWTQDVSQAPLASNSSAITQWLQSAGGWGLGHMQIDTSIDVLHADSSVVPQSFTPTSNFYTPDCDLVPVPVPPGGDVEGEPGYSCTGGGDCHLIVVQDSTQKLFEMWTADITDGVFTGGCLAVWDLRRVYPPSGRGEQCTSADAAGFPIAPLLFTADEVVAGRINHAIRFILPNDRIQNGYYVHPGSHSTHSTSGGADAPPYGTHLRLRADFPLDTLPSDQARTVAIAMQRYGLFLADGGNVALTAQSDNHTTAKWANTLGSHDLEAIQVTDMEVIDPGTPIVYTGDCVRNP
jgi:serine/threonine-protein kinase